jgi:hypothetical protein
VAAEDAVLVKDRERQRVCLVDAMAARGDPDQRLAVHLDTARLAVALRHQGEVDLAPLDQPGGLVRGQRAEVDPHLGVALGKAHQDARHEGAGIVVGGGDPDLAREGLAVEDGQGLGLRLEDASGMRQQQLAIGRQPRIPAIAGEELAAQLPLELAHLHAHRRLRAVHPEPGRGKAAGLGDGDEAPEVVRVEHGPIHERF